jgi:predicted nucleic acid-binding protein
MKSKFVLTDSCFWIGLFTPNDQYHRVALDIFDFISDYKIVLPWPCLYETVSTHLIRSRERALQFQNRIKNSNIELLDDTSYRDIAFHNVFSQISSHGFSYALTDAVIREIVADVNVKVDYLVTFNRKDFQDVCDHRRVELIDSI